MLKVVLDANIFISAMLTSGNSANVITCMERRSIYVFYPDQLIKELRKAPLKPRLKGRILPNDIDRMVMLLEKQAAFVALTHIPAICRDPDDDAYLACAAVSNCDYIVSGDKDLLDLGKSGQTKIVSPAQFLQILTEQKTN